jgi:hypothetical protein
MANPAIPGYFKIGETGLVTMRQKSLSRSNVPADYRILYFRYCDDVKKAEKALFEVLAPCRVGTGKEFFRVNLKKARSLINDICYDINSRNRLLNNEVSWDELSVWLDQEIVPASDRDLDINEEN